MSATGSEGFYADLPAFTRFADVHDPARYVPAPKDWDVVVTDVEGSTKAIEAGRYKDVNALGVSCIVALRNALPDLELPFVFGGDGATLLTPSSRRVRVQAALRGIRVMARENFDMRMRVGLVPVADLAQAGHGVRVARFDASKDVSFAMFAGSGLTEAERRIKSKELGPTYAIDDEGPVEASFDGFECRWQPLASQQGKVVSLLVQATAEDRDEAARTYRAVLETLAGLLDEAEGRPVAPANLNLATQTRAFEAEAKIRSGKAGGPRFLARRLVARLSAGIGRRLLSRERSALGFPGDVYRAEVTANTDFRKFDDTLRMVLDLNDAQHEQLETALAKLHEGGAIVYGTHVANATLMTCAIGDYKGQHVHFVDGADGGYALAARQLKQQLKQR